MYHHRGHIGDLLEKSAPSWKKTEIPHLSCKNCIKVGIAQYWNITKYINKTWLAADVLVIVIMLIF